MILKCNKMITLLLMICWFGGTFSQPRSSENAVIHLVSIEKRGEFQSSNDAPLPNNYTFVYKIWEMDDWITPQVLKSKFNFNQNSGEVTVQRDGIYSLYAQFTYHDWASKLSFAINIDGVNVAKCIKSNRLIDFNENLERTNHNLFHTCSIFTTRSIRKNQKVSIRSMYPGLFILLKNEFTFWGMTKL